MIQENELRIGNFIQTPSGLLPLDEIGYKDGAGYMKIEGRNIGYYLDACNPIPLTEEWLLKFGFIKTYSLNYEGRIMALPVIARIFTGGVYIETGGIYLGDRVNYVHEYQNLHFALSGQELEVKP